ASKPAAAVAASGRRAVSPSFPFSELVITWVVRVDAEPPLAAPQHLVSLDRLEVVLLQVVGDFIAERGSLRVGGAEVDAGPHSRVDDLLERVREPLEAARGTGFVAEGAEANLVGAEEVLERVHERTGRAGVPRGVVGEGRREEQRRVADR